AGGEAHAADQDRRDIAQDIAEQIRTDHYIERVRTANEVHRGSIHQQRFSSDARELFGDSLERAIPKHHAEALRIRLGDGGYQLLLVTLHGKLEGEADDALDAAAREDRRLNRDLVRLVMINESTYLRVLAFRVLAHDHHVDVARVPARERRFHTLVEHSRTYVRILVERSAD